MVSFKMQKVEDMSGSGHQDSCWWCLLLCHELFFRFMSVLSRTPISSLRNRNLKLGQDDKNRLGWDHSSFHISMQTSLSEQHRRQTSQRCTKASQSCARWEQAQNFPLCTLFVLSCRQLCRNLHFCLSTFFAWWHLPCGLLNQQGQLCFDDNDDEEDDDDGMMSFPWDAASCLNHCGFCCRSDLEGFCWRSKR